MTRSGFRLLDFSGEWRRSLIRQEQERITALKVAVDEGMASGVSSRSLDEIWSAAEERFRANAVHH